MLRMTRLALAAAAAGLLAACGSGSDDNDPSVNSMAATPAAYGRTALWTVSGLNLDRGVAFAITAGSCENVAEVGEGTANQRQFICLVSSLGELIGQVNDAGGNRLASLRVIIPTPAVRLTLAQGTIEVELDPVSAPVSVRNFLNYVNTGFYHNTLFHRVIADFVIQGGGYTPGNPDPVFKTATQPNIVLESNNGLSNVRGTIAMARGSDPNSATSQYYFNVVDNLQLDYKSEQEPGYAVFGTVTSGMNVADAISVVPARAIPSIGLFNVPVTDVIVTTARQIR